MELQGGQEHPGKARETRDAQNPFETPGAPERIRKNQKEPEECDSVAGLVDEY